MLPTSIRQPLYDSFLAYSKQGSCQYPTSLRCVVLLLTSNSPAIAYYLSRFYRRSELAFRLALYIVMGPLSGAFSGLLASAILRLSRFGGTHGWQMIFVIEGIMTLAFSLLCVLDSDRQTRNCRLFNY